MLAKTVYIFNYYSCLLPLSYPNINIKEIIDTGVVISDSMENQQTLEADTVVLSLGLVPEKQLHRELRGKTPNLYLIGDAREARNIMGAVWDAYEVARSI